ncbi:MAG: hypothetical protein IPF99_14850 [Deltaproteobacteria bacterium]|nr:hypothetical protein [Deltaproteobacteria bacterium]
MLATTCAAAGCSSPTFADAGVDQPVVLDHPDPKGPLDSGPRQDASTACPTGQARCGPACVDLSSDTRHCGACGRVCPAGVACRAGACPPSNDDRASATPIALTPAELVLSGSTDGATFDGPTGCGSGAPNVWYSLRLAQRAVVYADTAGSTYNTKIYLVDAAGAVVSGACNDDSGCTTGGFTSELQSRLARLLAAGSYAIAVSGSSATDRGVHAAGAEHPDELRELLLRRPHRRIDDRERQAGGHLGPRSALRAGRLGRGRTVVRELRRGGELALQRVPLRRRLLRARHRSLPLRPGALRLQRADGRAGAVQRRRRRCLQLSRHRRRHAELRLSHQRADAPRDQRAGGRRAPHPQRDELHPPLRAALKHPSTAAESGRAEEGKYASWPDALWSQGGGCVAVVVGSCVTPTPRCVTRDATTRARTRADLDARCSSPPDSLLTRPFAG